MMTLTELINKFPDTLTTIQKFEEFEIHRGRQISIQGKIRDITGRNVYLEGINKIELGYDHNVLSKKLNTFSPGASVDIIAKLIQVNFSFDNGFLLEIVSIQ